MAVLMSTLHESAIAVIDAYDIDALNWSDGNVTSFDLRVLEAAQETVADCTREERIRLKMSNTRRSGVVHADVAACLYKLKATAVDPGLVASLIIEMYHEVVR